MCVGGGNGVPDGLRRALEVRYKAEIADDLKHQSVQLCDRLTQVCAIERHVHQRLILALQPDPGSVAEPVTHGERSCGVQQLNTTEKVRARLMMRWNWCAGIADCLAGSRRARG